MTYAVEEAAAPRSVARWWAAIIGPPVLARTGKWALFWIYTALDLWALLEGLQGALLTAAVILILGRVFLLVVLGSISADSRAAVTGSAWVLGTIAWVAALTLVLLGRGSGAVAARLSEFPEWRGLHNTLAAHITATIRYMTVQFDPFFSAIKSGLLVLLSTLEMMLTQIPWPVFFLLVGFLAWQRGGWRVLAVIWMALAYLGIFGFWKDAITTSALVLSALVVCVALGVPLGVASAKSRVVKAILAPILDFMQTLPSFVYLLPAVAFFSIGKPPALIATVVFALPPLIRLTGLGLEQVPTYVREAMYANGATPLQTLLKAELPLALPSIQAGINQCIMLSLSMVVIAALIGGGGLGYDVLFALQNIQHGRGLLAGIAIVAVAIMFDRLVRSNKTSRRN